MQAKIEDMTLGNVSEGAAEDQFQELLEALHEIIEDPGPFQTSSGNLKAKVTVEIDFDLDLETGVLLTSVGSILKPPKRRKATRAAFHRGGGFRVMPEPKQDGLPFAGPRVVEEEDTENG